MGVVTTIKRCAEATPHANRTSAENNSTFLDLYVAVLPRLIDMFFKLVRRFPQ
jgi:hypothetical protein